MGAEWTVWAACHSAFHPTLESLESNIIECEVTNFCLEHYYPSSLDCWVCRHGSLSSKPHSEPAPGLDS